MNTIHEPGRELPVIHECDLCVVGGSCTGVFAAVRAARLGAKVALIENQGFFGGVAGAGLVHVWHSLRDMTDGQQIIGGLTAEILDRLQARGAAEFLSPTSPHSAYIINTEELKIELDRFVTESGVRPFLHTRFVAPVMTDGRLRAVIIEDKTGRRAIAAKIFIDATGDGDLVARMGLPWFRNDDLQPPTTVAIFDNFEAVRREDKDGSCFKEVFNLKHPNALKQGFLWGAPLPGRPGAFMVAGTRVHHADCSDAEQLTAAELEGRRQVRAMHDILREHVKGGAGVVLAGVSATIGIRETRHVECLHRLTGAEVLQGVSFPDAIGNGTYPVDVHHSAKAGLTFRYLDGRESYHEPGRPSVLSRWREEAAGVTPFYQIPYRALVPQGAHNVLVAGRLIGTDREAYGAIRVMVNCNQTGEAAGVAATLALQHQSGVAEVDPAELRQTLAAGGSCIR